ncbi:uncharacterized protein METZ01_LOCUS130022, partial [marine metagenome]
VIKAGSPRAIRIVEPNFERRPRGLIVKRAYAFLAAFRLGVIDHTRSEDIR